MFKEISRDTTWPVYRPVTATDVLDSEAFLDWITDIPSSVPINRLPISHAGIGGQYVQVTIPNFTDPAAMIILSGVATVGVSLMPEQRGGHMSRLVEIIADSTTTSWPSLADYIGALARRAAEVQRTTHGHATLETTTIVTRQTPVTCRPSSDQFDVHARATVNGDTCHTQIGLAATVTTACPCTQAYSTYATVLELADSYGLELANELGKRQVTFTHSQRATLTVTVDATPIGLDLADCYLAACEGAHVVHELLKRDDEHEMVRRAHIQPQFTEDVVRDVAAALVHRATRQGASGTTALRVTCTALESIHAHTVESAIEGTVTELAGYMP